MRYFRKIQEGYTTVEIFIVVILLTCAGGYIANIVKLVHAFSDVMTMKTILRAVGVLVIPLGAVMGFL